MNDRIINALVEAYKQKDVPLEQLISDPLFRSMTPERQVEAIQAYAGVLSMGSKRPEAHKIIARIAGSGALVGATTFGLPALMTKLPGTEKFGMAALGAVVGGVFGAGKGIFEFHKDKKNFNEMQRNLKTVERTHDTTDAVKVLISKRPSIDNPYIHKLFDPMMAIQNSQKIVEYKVKKDFPEAFKN